jgi:hypothetical protein
MARDIHDEIGASISNICLLTGLVEKSLSLENAEQGRKFLTRINEEANKIHDTISDTIKILDPAYETLEGLTSLLGHHAQDVFRYHEIDFSINLTPQLRSIRLKPTCRRDFYLILKESLHNIARHSKATSVLIEFREKTGELYCRVNDNGCGFNSAVSSRNSGLKNMTRRAKLIYARLWIDTRPEQGTTIHLLLPFRSVTLLHRLKQSLLYVARSGYHRNSASSQPNTLPEFTPFSA